MGFPRGSVVKNRTTIQEMQETRVQSLDREDLLEEGMATHSNILAWIAWRIPWTEEPWGHQELDTTEAVEHTRMHVDTFLNRPSLIFPTTCEGDLSNLFHRREVDTNSDLFSLLSNQAGSPDNRVALDLFTTSPALSTEPCTHQELNYHSECVE